MVLHPYYGKIRGDTHTIINRRQIAMYNLVLLTIMQHGRCDPFNTIYTKLNIATPAHVILTNGINTFFNKNINN